MPRRPASVVIVIEAPGKIAAFRAAFPSDDCEVIATGGHFCHTKNEGLDADDPQVGPGWIEAERHPSESVVETLQRVIGPAREIIIATDPDAEGDVIARDVVATLQSLRLSPTTCITRMRPMGLSADMLTQAARLRCLWDETHDRAAYAGDARRVVDKMIGLTAVELGSGGMGRVSVRLLANIADDPLQPYRASLMLPAADGGRPFVAQARAGSRSIADSYVRICAEHGPVLGESIDVSTASPMNYPEAVVAVASGLGVGASEASMLVQKSYELGILSYPRSMNRVIEGQSYEFLTKMARDASLPWVPSAASRHVAVQERGHPAPAPIAALSITKPLKVLAPPEAAAAVIGRRLVECGTHVEIVRPFAQKPTSPLRDVVFSRPVTPLPWQVKAGEASSVTQLAPDLLLIERMGEAEIGRPSTMVSHADKVGKRNQLEDYKLAPEIRLRLKMLPQEWRDPGLCRMVDALDTGAVAASPEALVDAMLRVAGEKTYNIASAAVGDRPPFRPVMAGNAHDSTTKRPRGAVAATPDNGLRDY
jgi:DNA topoisomerase-1